MLRIAHNAVTARVFDASREVKLEIHRLLSYRVDGAEHMAAFQSGGWNGRASFFNFDSGTFPRGFVRLVAQGLRKVGVEVQIVAKPLPAPLGPEKPKVDDFGDSERYDYQPETVEKLLRHGNITVQVATGGGKSRIARLAFCRIARPTLFLTTRGILMHQMREAVEKLTGEPVAVLGDGEWGVPYVKEDGSEGRKLTRFTVGMVQTLAQRLEGADPTADERTRDHQVWRRDAAAEVLSRFELVIAEEAHEVSGPSFYKVMSACTNAAYRMALTATPFMKDSEEANMNLLASCGPIAIQISEKMLIDRGILARPYFKFVKLPEEHKPPKLYKSTPWQRAYQVGIVENEYRNRLITVEVMRAKRYGLTSMVLVQHKAHGAMLRERMTAAGLNAAFIFGENNQTERKACLQMLGNGHLDVLIGSTILDVGVDVPAVGMIVLAGGGKAEVALRQRVGRGLREKKSGPNVAFIVDFADDFNTHLRGHARERRSIIESTPGFAENIVTDFNFAELGLTRIAA
jgi:superfamily II DNA or RNA helicase